MTENHPDQLELLAYVEEELDPSPRRELGEHLRTCSACGEQVRRLESGREALQAAPRLELPGDRIETIMSSLPERPDPWGFLRPVRRALVVAAPVAAAAALVGVFVLAGTQLGGGGNGDSDEAAQLGADEAGGEATEEDRDPEPEAAPLQDAPEGTTFVRTAEGPVGAIVRALEREGIQAEVDAQGRVIAEGRAGEVRAALTGRPTGDVPVYVR
ncbi:MAG: anti-sigma factor family protein [Gaiellaceae bacterium]